MSWVDLGDVVMSRRWMRTHEAAEHLNVTSAALVSWRGKKVGPRYSRLGGKLVVYALDDLDQWVVERGIEPSMKTSSTVEAA